MGDFTQSQKKYLRELFDEFQKTIHRKIEILEENLTRRITEVENQCEERLRVNETRIKELEKDKKQLTIEIENINRKQREKNLIIYGLKTEPERRQEVVRELIRDKLQIEIQHQDIDDVHMLGRTEGCPMLIQLSTSKLKRNALNKSKALKGTGIHISPDLTKEERSKRRILTQLVKEAKAKGIIAKIRGNKIISGDEEFTPQQFRDSINPDINPSMKVQQVGDTEEVRGNLVNKTLIVHRPKTRSTSQK